MQRSIVHSYLEEFMKTQSINTVLEINCGTGEDALWFAARGKKVLATDISERMIEIAREKSMVGEEHRLVSFRTCGFEDINTLQDEAPFDLIFSNFGGLNCIDQSAIKKLSEDCKGLLNPGGHFIAVIMSKFCFWETLYFLVKLKPSEAFRRRNKKPVKVELNGQEVDTYYYSTNQFAKLFHPLFEVKEIGPVGLFIPPSYLENFFKKRKGMLNWLSKRERSFTLSKRAANMADHILIHLQLRD